MDRKQLTLYGITDRDYLDDISFEEAVEEALQGGVTILQLREKELDEQSIREEAKTLKEICKKYGTSLILDDNVALVKELDLDGVHLGQSDMPAKEARSILGSDKIIGITAKTIEQAKKAESDGADYLGVGAVFETTTKPGAKHISASELKDIVSSVKIPVVAIGGITRENVNTLKGTNIAGVAVSADIFNSENICKAAAEMLQEVKKL